MEALSVEPSRVSLNARWESLPAKTISGASIRTGFDLSDGNRYNQKGLSHHSNCRTKWTGIHPLFLIQLIKSPLQLLHPLLEFFYRRGKADPDVFLAVSPEFGPATHEYLPFS